MPRKIADNGFRLIALRTLPALSQQEPTYLKILKPDTFYYFYNSYQINSKNDKITQRAGISSDFYNIKKGTKVNISAIVGKNGSGKSTLVELIFRAINNIAAKQKPPLADLEYTDRLRIALYFQTDRLYKLLIDDLEVEVWKYDDYGNREYEPETQFRFAEFFYTIAVNYSHFAYNIGDMEDRVNWLEGLFHKNDGYQTPLVINPLRKDGNIEINNENHLVKSRLISNLVLPARKNSFNFRNLTGRLEAYQLELTLNPSKREKVIYKFKDKNDQEFVVKLDDVQSERDDLLTELNKVYDFGYPDLDQKAYEIPLDYIFYKLVSIASKYTDYANYFSKQNKSFYQNRADYNIADFISKLIEDESHITFKLRQTLNFLKFKHLDLTQKFVPLGAFSRNISALRRQFKLPVSEVINMIPPPIFKIDILCRTRDEEQKKVNLMTLSWAKSSWFTR